MKEKKKWKKKKKKKKKNKLKRIAVLGSLFNQRKNEAVKSIDFLHSNFKKKKKNLKINHIFYQLDILMVMLFYGI